MATLLHMGATQLCAVSGWVGADASREHHGVVHAACHLLHVGAAQGVHEAWDGLVAEVPVPQEAEGPSPPCVYVTVLCDARVHSQRCGAGAGVVLATGSGQEGSMRTPVIAALWQ